MAPTPHIPGPSEAVGPPLPPLALPPARLAALAAALTVSDGGFTIDLVTGADVVEGYAVSVDPYWERIYDRPVTADDLVRYLADKDRAAALPGRVLGGWNDPDTGRIFLDVSVVVSTLDAALELGRASRQDAVFDLSGGKSIPIPKVANPAVVSLNRPRADGAEDVTDGGLWRYHERRRGKHDRTYTGHVTHVVGGEAERIRGDLAAAVLDLLKWAAKRQSSNERDAG